MDDRTVKNAKSEQSSHVGAEEPTPGEEAKARAWLDAWVPRRGFRGEELARLDAERSLAVLLADERTSIGSRVVALRTLEDAERAIRQQLGSRPSFGLERASEGSALLEVCREWLEGHAVVSPADLALFVQSLPAREALRERRKLLHAMDPGEALLCGSIFRDDGAISVGAGSAWLSEVTCPVCLFLLEGRARRVGAPHAVRVEPGGCGIPGCSLTSGQHAHEPGPMPGSGKAGGS